MAKELEIVIVGGGHNGLVCANYLARSGAKVLVLERYPVTGGACITEELWPNYKVSVAAYVLSLLQPQVILDLDLKRFGYEVLPSPPVFHPFPDGRYLVGYEDIGRICDEFAKFSKRDAERYPAFINHLNNLMPFVRRLLWQTPPVFASGKLSDLADVTKFVWKFRDIGNNFYHVYDLLTLSVHDYLGRWFESEEIKAALSGISASASNAGPMTQGSAFVLLRGLIRDQTTEAGGGGFVRGGMGTVTQALTKSALAAGVKIRTTAEVQRIVVKNNRAVGVILDSGEEIKGSKIVSGASAKLTFINMIEKENLSEEFRTQIKNYRTKSSAFKINLALAGLPQFKSFDSAKIGFPYPAQVRLAPSMEYIERAFDASKYGGIADHPYMFITTPSVVDTSVAPPGKHVMGIMGSHVSYDYCKNLTEAEVKEALLERVSKELSIYAPNFGDLILHSQVLSPVDIERRFSMPGGHVHHGELTIDQIFGRRPAPGAANYRTPIANLYICGASSHPGGGVTGIPGYNAAREIIRDMKMSWKGF